MYTTMVYVKHVCLASIFYTKNLKVWKCMKKCVYIYNSIHVKVIFTR